MEDDLAKKALLNSLSEAAQRPLGGTGTISSVKWMRDKFNDLVRGSRAMPIESKAQLATRFPTDLNKSFFSSKVNKQAIGRMFMFYYDPKTKAKLEYYDQFPLVLIVNYTPDGFTGLNLHYVHPLLRIKILEALVRNVNVTHLTEDFLQRNVENKQIQMNYQILMNHAQFPVLKPCFKRYLFSHIRSSFMYIDPTEWPKAILLPVEKFRGATKAQVFSESAAVASNRNVAKSVVAKEAVAKTVRPAMSSVAVSRGED